MESNVLIHDLDMLGLVQEESAERGSELEIRFVEPVRFVTYLDVLEAIRDEMYCQKFEQRIEQYHGRLVMVSVEGVDWAIFSESRLSSSKSSGHYYIDYLSGLETVDNPFAGQGFEL